MTACPTGTDFGGITATTGTGTASGHHASSATQWSNPVGNGSTESFSSNNWAIGDYYQFGGASTVGLMDIGLYWDQTRSSTGPSDFKVQYSLDGTSFLDTGVNYIVPADTWSSGGTPQTTSMFFADLRSITALENDSDVFFRLVATSAPSSTGGSNRIDNVRIVHNFDPPIIVPPPPKELPQAGDVVIGLGISSSANTVKMIRGENPVVGGGTLVGSPWTSDGFVRGIEFDNKNGTLHNVKGNLLATDEGGTSVTGTPPSATISIFSGEILSFATQGDPEALPAAQVIGNTRTGMDAIGHTGGVTLTRLSGLSVSPDNLKVAVAGMDTGKVLVYDYTAGNSLGTGALLEDGRETSAIMPLAVLDDPNVTGTQGNTNRYGTAWKDNDTVLALSSNGELYSVNATTMATTLQTTLGITLLDSVHTSLAYNPDVAEGTEDDYIYAVHSAFNESSDPQSRNRLFILDPTDYSLVNQVDLSTLDTYPITATATGATAREISLDEDGNLFISTFGSGVFVIPGINDDPLNVANPVLWHQSTTFSSFLGMDIGFAPPEEADADYNEDGTINAADYVAWRKIPSLFGGDPGYDLWKQQFGQASPGAGGGGAVPEPTGAVLLAIGMALFCGKRRIG
jgi:hypothetical protein